MARLVAARTTGTDNTAIAELLVQRPTALVVPVI